MVNNLCDEHHPESPSPACVAAQQANAPIQREYSQSLLVPVNWIALAKAASGWDDLVACVTKHKASSCAWTAAALIPFGAGRDAKIARLLKGAEGARDATAELSALSATGKIVMRNGLTRAGRAYQKHMIRGQLPKVAGKDLNAAGQDLLDSILHDTHAKQTMVKSGNFAGGTRFIGSSGIGATFDAKGVFRYFGVYRR